MVTDRVAYIGMHCLSFTQFFLFYFHVLHFCNLHKHNTRLSFEVHPLMSILPLFICVFFIYLFQMKHVFSGTSNWSGDYFVNTAGSALVVNQTSAQTISPTVQEQLQAVFERDWDSSYSREINPNTNHKYVC